MALANETVCNVQKIPGGAYHVMCVHMYSIWTVCVCSHGEDMVPFPCLTFLSFLSLTCMEHTEGRWSRDKLGYGNKDLTLNHQPTPVSVEVNIHQLQVFIGLMNDFLLQHSEHRSTYVYS